MVIIYNDKRTQRTIGMIVEDSDEDIMVFESHMIFTCE